jgi:hypothetical protein
MNYFTKTVLMIGLAFLPNSVLGKSTPTPTPSSSSVQDEDITATSVEEFPSSGLVKLDKVISDKFRSKSQHSLREFSKPWKFKNIYSFLPKNIQDKNHPNLSSDDSGNYLVADNFLYDGKSNRIIFQASQYNGLEISSNGKYLYVRGPEEGQEGNKFNGMYLIPEMTKISISKGWVFSWFLGRGRFAIVLKNNQQGIVDLENPNQVIKKAIVWGNFFESQNGEMILNQEDKEMVLYNLPDFSIKQKFSDIGSGTPFINSTGTIIGCNRGLCYLVNTITGVTKSFGINGDNCSDLVEGASIQNNFTKQRLKKIPQAPISMDVVTKIISLSTFKTLKDQNPQNRIQDICLDPLMVNLAVYFMLLLQKIPRMFGW